MSKVVGQESENTGGNFSCSQGLCFQQRQERAMYHEM